MTGRIRISDPRWLDVTDATLTELGADALVMAESSSGDVIPGRVEHDGQRFGVRLEAEATGDTMRIRRRAQP